VLLFYDLCAYYRFENKIADERWSGSTLFEIHEHIITFNRFLLSFYFQDAWETRQETFHGQRLQSCFEKFIIVRNVEEKRKEDVPWYSWTYNTVDSLWSRDVEEILDKITFAFLTGEKATSQVWTETRLSIHILKLKIQKWKTQKHKGK